MKPSPADVLARLYSLQAEQGNFKRRRSGEPILRKFADALTKVVRDNDAKIVIEVGMAFGASSLAILAGLGQGGQLISIDPHQDDFDRAGQSFIASCSRADAHRLIEQADFQALPQLLADGVVADLVYIDGMHTFDYVALDAFYADKLVPVGGIIGFNDCGFRSVHKFLRYFRKHRSYEEIDVGLPADYRGANPLITLVRTIEGRSNQDRYFRKLDTWEPQLNYFKSF